MNLKLKRELWGVKKLGSEIPAFARINFEIPTFAGIKKRQATYITPLRPLTFAAFPPWRIQQELVV